MNKVEMQETILKWIDGEVFNSLSKFDKLLLRKTKSETVTKNILRNIEIISEKIGDKNDTRVTIKNGKKIVAIREFRMVRNENKS